MFEPKDFEPTLKMLVETFEDKKVISLNKAAKYVGCKPDRLLSDKTFPVKRFGGQYRVSIVGFARWLSA